MCWVLQCDLLKTPQKERLVHLSCPTEGLAGGVCCVSVLGSRGPAGAREHRFWQKLQNGCV